MKTLDSRPNPFALLVDPQSVLDAVSRSERLTRLRSRVCHPLDLPLMVPKDPDSENFDRWVDASEE
jgi:hypothetical protein